MRKFLFVKALFLFVCSIGYSQKSPFKDVVDINPIKVERLHSPEEFKLYSLDVNELFKLVLNAPKISELPSSVVLKFPDIDGKFSSFYVYDNSNMEEGLAVENPNIRSFKAVSINNSLISLSFSLSNVFGFHAVGTNVDGSTFYIDNYTVDLKTVIIYNRSSLENPKSQFDCLVTSVNESELLQETSDISTFSYDNKRRNFRLALACTTEYSDFHIQRAPNSVPKTTQADKKNIVLAAMNVTLTRLNQIFERDINVHLNLVNNNREIIFVDNDNFANSNASLLIDQSQNVISSIIGNVNYDIGHTFSTGAGGLARIGVCFDSLKASGITGAAAPVGDAYDVDYVAHEMGHQFGANHTFNNPCQGNVNVHTAMEVGSGSTIMSYAGICPPNVQMNVNDYYHYISIKEMQTFLQSTSCAQKPPINFSAPVIQPLIPKTIPYGTPFILTANAADVNTSDVLTYTFEQVDAQLSAQPPVDTATVGPSFRSMPPNTSNFRSFPTRTEVNNGTTNSNGIIKSLWEQLAKVARSYNFIVTVRDNNPLGGSVVFSQPVEISVANTGPFLITYPNNNPTIAEPTWYMGSSKTITWNVAGTTSNGINTSHVNIKISTDGGVNYTMLLANTPNDGSETLTIPNNLDNSYDARIMIEAVGNIYYTVSKKLVLWNPTLNVPGNELTNVLVYPNPTSDILNISFDKENNTQTIYTIYDITGKLVTKLKSSSNQKNETIYINSLSSGTYILMTEHNNKTSNTKFVKN